MKIWMIRRGKNIWILYNNRGGYLEFSSTWIFYAKGFNLKRRKIKIDHSVFDYNFTFYDKFPNHYKKCYQKGWYIEGSSIYYHQVIRMIKNKIYKRK